MEGALFVKKMNVENIDYETKQYGKNSFFYCEDYIRKLEKSNSPLTILADAFSQCYTTYSSIRYKTYRKNSNSQEFIDLVINNIENHNFNELNKLLPLRKFEKSGFIHTLANSEDKDVKWGDKDVE